MYDVTAAPASWSTTPVNVRSDSMPDETSAAVFTRIYEQHARAILAYALRRVDTPADAADVVAETFLVVWRRLDAVPRGASLRPWLFGVARRVTANLHRGGRRRRALAQRLRECVEQAAVIADHADSVAAGITDRHVIQTAFSKLQPTDREVLELTVWEGLSPMEIARVLDEPAATVRSRLHRARGRLHRLLEVERRAAAGHVPGDRDNPAAMDAPR